MRKLQTLLFLVAALTVALTLIAGQPPETGLVSLDFMCEEAAIIQATLRDFGDRLSPADIRRLEATIEQLQALGGCAPKSDTVHPTVPEADMPRDL